MRELDEQGVHWEVVVGRESWGSFYAIFVPREASVAPRESSLSGTSYEEAYLEVEALSPDELLELFRRSTPKVME